MSVVVGFMVFTTLFFIVLEEIEILCERLCA